MQRSLAPACPTPVGFAASAVQVLIPQTERATRLAELKPLGQQVEALRQTPCRRSASWGLVTIPRLGGAGRHRTSHHVRAQSRREDPPGWPAARQAQHTPLRPRHSRASMLLRGVLGLDLADGQRSQNLAGDVKPAQLTRREVKPPNLLARTDRLPNSPHQPVPGAGEA